MTHRCVVAFSLVVVALVTACTSGEQAVISENGETVVVGGTSNQPDQSPESGSTQPAFDSEGGSGVIFDGSAGADDAGDAVSGLLAAINSGDILGALAHIDPAERDLIADLYLTTVEAAADAWPQFGGDDAIAELEIEVLALTPLRSTMYNDHLAWVETDEVEFYMAAPTEVASAFFSHLGPWGPGSGYLREEFTHHEDDWSELTQIGGSSSDVLPGLMVTEIDGRWYVSFGRTVLELLRVDGEFETAFPAERQVIATSPSATPQMAVVEFLDALAGDQMAAAAEHLVAAEGQAFADYPAMLELWLPGLLDIEVDLDPDSLRVVQEDNGRATVEASEITLEIEGSDHDGGEIYADGFDYYHELQLTDGCLTVNNKPVWCEPTENDATIFTSLYRDLGWNGLRVMTVRSDDGWSVSVYETLAHYGLPIVRDPLYGLGYSQLSLPIFGGPLEQTLINETAKTLPVQHGDTIELEPYANNRLLIARINASRRDRTLAIDSATLDRRCSITIWNTDMVTHDWYEEPEYYDEQDCEDHFERPLEIPAGVELTLTLWGYGENLEPIIAELR